MVWLVEVFSVKKNVVLLFAIRSLKRTPKCNIQLKSTMESKELINDKQRLMSFGGEDVDSTVTTEQTVNFKDECFGYLDKDEVEETGRQRM